MTHDDCTPDRGRPHAHHAADLPETGDHLWQLAVEDGFPHDDTVLIRWLDRHPDRAADILDFWALCLLAEGEQKAVR